MNRPRVPTGPITIKRRKEEDADDPGILVFTIEGGEEDARPYYMPRKISAGVAIEVLEQMEGMGSDAASVWLLRRVLGEDAVEELKDPENDLGPEQLEGIVALVSDHVLGQVEGMGKR